MSDFTKGLFYSPDDGGDGPPPDDKPKENQADEGLKWETWHGELPEPAQKLVADHVSGLKTALDSERDARKTAEGDLRDVAGKLEKGSEAQNEVLKLADAVAAGNLKADFYEDAHKAGVSNLKLAHHIATTDDLFDRKGNVNFDKMKEAYPELFVTKKAPPANPGDGTGGKLPGEKVDMNALIRKKANR